MRPFLETIELAAQRKSVLVFERRETNFEPYWHYHPEVELTLITGGSGTRFIGDHISNYEAGDLVLVGSYLPHQWISANSGKVKKDAAVVIQFRGDLFANYPECQAISEMLTAAKSGIYFQEVNDGLLQKLRLIPERDEGRQLSALLEILLELADHSGKIYLSGTSHFGARKSDENERKINGIINAILEHIENPLSINELADQANLVPQSFCRWFRQQTGQSYVQFLNKVRLENACALLKSTDYQVHDIALKSGFDNISHFNRTFKQHIGLTPTKFRLTNNEFDRTN